MVNVAAESVPDAVSVRVAAGLADSAVFMDGRWILAAKWNTLSRGGLATTKIE